MVPLCGDFPFTQKKVWKWIFYFVHWKWVIHTNFVLRKISLMEPIVKIMGGQHLRTRHVQADHIKWTVCSVACPWQRWSEFWKREPRSPLAGQSVSRGAHRGQPCAQGFVEAPRSPQKPHWTQPPELHMHLYSEVREGSRWTPSPTSGKTRIWTQ